MSSRGIDNVVLVDMDGVLADFDAAVLDRLPPDVKRVDRSHFHIAEDYPRHAADVEYITGHPDFFLHLPLVDDALLGWQRLIDAGYRPRVCTAPLSRNRRSAEHKLAWLRRHFVPHFGELVVSEAIIDREKYRYDGLALLDDRIRGWDDPHLNDTLEAARRRA